MFEILLDILTGSPPGIKVKFNHMEKEKQEKEIAIPQNKVRKIFGSLILYFCYIEVKLCVLYGI
jgi:hypothetical protein